jgi:pimeloyl-ACP methyl ester carboxylesterase
MAGPAFRDHFILSHDGLKLHARDYGTSPGGTSPGGTSQSGAPQSARLPVVCLPGLTRTLEDFDVLAPALAHDAAAPRRVIALSLRGRGQSSRDPNPENYAVPVEAADVLTVAAALGIDRAVIVGTSRGGLIALTLGAMQPAFLAGVVFNDIGPRLDMAGLVRIKGYAGRITRPASWAEAVANHQAVFGREFPNVTEAGWLAWAKRAWREEDGRFKGTCDPQVAGSLATLDEATPLPELWPLFDALPDSPLMVIRGALSNLLSAATVAEMQTRRPRLETVEVPDEGHAPLLEDAPTVARIAAFVRGCDGG